MGWLDGFKQVFKTGTRGKGGFLYHGRVVNIRRMYNVVLSNSGNNTIAVYWRDWQRSAGISNDHFLRTRKMQPPGAAG